MTESMPDFKQQTVAKLREMLINSGKYTEEQADQIKGKANLVKAIMELHENEDDETGTNFDSFEQLIISPEKIEEVNMVGDIDVPNYNDIGWHDYVMSQFDESELQDGKYPKVTGLRRVAQKLLGPIVFSGPIELTPATTIDKAGRAACIYQIGFEHGQTFAAAAGAWVGSVDDEFAVFPEAIAETRAEVRALRKALNLKVAGAEELTSKDTRAVVESSSGEWEPNDRVSDTQINFIKKMCERLNIDVSKFINSGKQQYSDINEVPRQIGADMIKKLNEFQSKNNDVTIPDDIILAN